MIIDARNDVVTLSGTLTTNVWPSIQAAAHLLLRQNPSGILIDAHDLTACSPTGIKTFVEAIAYIDRYRARIVLCNVPDCVSGMIQIVPGARSSVPIAATLAEGRASLELAREIRENKRRSDRSSTEERPILVPLVPLMTTTREAIGLAIQIGSNIAEVVDADPTIRRKKKVAPVIHLAYILEVPRSLPLTAPFPEEEEQARVLLEEAQSFALKAGTRVEAHVVRARDAAEEIVAQAARVGAESIVVSLPIVSEAEQEPLREMIRSVLESAPCEVLIKRVATSNQLVMN